MIRQVPGSEALRDVAEQQRAAVAGLTAEHRSARGQFMTPPAVAELMASFMPRLPPSVRLLDAGAGCGALSAAFVLEACARPAKPSTIHLVAYELETSLLPVLTMTLERCQRACKAAGITFSAEVRTEDFIEAAVAGQDGRLFRGSAGSFSHAILNPPYCKIASSSRERSVLRDVGIESTNSYSAFVLLATRLLGPGGHLVAITPRSFCNGPYFRAFRREVLSTAALKRAHLFRRRDVAFNADEVLQENVIVHLAKGGRSSTVRISVSDGPTSPITCKRLPLSCVVDPGDPECFIHLPVEQDDLATSRAIRGLPCKLEDLGIQVSTGRVVDFRVRAMLATAGTPNTVPLIWSSHMARGGVVWPAERYRKPEAIRRTKQTDALLVPAGYYVLVKRFSTREEKRRIVAALLSPADVPTDVLGIENHLNYFHSGGVGMDLDVARGLTAFLNSAEVDGYFRQFNGHTQVNATDLRSLRYPTLAALRSLGRRATAHPARC